MNDGKSLVIIYLIFCILLIAIVIKYARRKEAILIESLKMDIEYHDARMKSFPKGKVSIVKPPVKKSKKK